MKLNKHDIDRVIKLTPDPVKTLMSIHGKDLVLAGGFVRDAVLHVRAKDVDLFPSSLEVSDRAVLDLSMLTKKLGEKDKYTSTKNAHSFSNVSGRFVQIIHRWTYPTPHDLLNSFDFTVACAAVWYDRNTHEYDSVCLSEFYPDLAAKRLTFRHPERNEDPAGSLMRVMKFIKKGYNIPSESLAGVVARLLRSSQPLGFGGGGSEQDITKYVHKCIASVTGES